MKKDVIKIRGARQHNLKNIDIDVPKNEMICFTGVSGSGKSSLAFDTIYAEGQRRYVESLSTYARQFLGLMDKPEVDVIEGLSPAISIDQKAASKNPRSTVGTITEAYDYLRLMYAKIGHPHCPVCGKEISNQSVDEIVQAAIKQVEKSAQKTPVSRFFVLSPIVIDKKGEFTSLFDNLKAKGFNKVRIDGQIRKLSEELVLIKTNKHTIEVVVDQFTVKKKDLKDKIYKKNLKSRLADSAEQSLKISEGLVILTQIMDKSLEIPEYPKKFEDHLYSERFACPVDNIQIPEIEPRTFSFNSPHGACSKCSGIGKILKAEPKFIFSEELSITEGGILPYSTMFEQDTWFSRLVRRVCEEQAINFKQPIKHLNNGQKNIILYGTGDRQYKVEGTNRFGKITNIYEAFSGIVNELEKKHANTKSNRVRKELEKYMTEKSCPQCNGARLKKEALSITVDKLSINEVTQLSIKDALDWVQLLIKSPKSLTKREKRIGKLVLKELETRLKFLSSVGLDYLSLERGANTLSAGEAQRIRLASQIGSGLTGVLYVLDEPTIGLHQRDNLRLINTLKKLRDLGNTVVVVEHDEDMIRNANTIIDFGPGAGKKGGMVVEKGNVKDIESNNKSITGKYLSGKKDVEIEKQSHIDADNNPKSLVLKGARQYNLKNINATFPLGKLVAITGVSGSGKSTLLVETLYPALKMLLNPRSKEAVGKYDKLSGAENADKVILIDQSPIGRTPRSNPATYTKLFDYVRETFASTKQARTLGFKKGRFSFNVKGGRCEACEGQGQTKIEMQFMSDIWVKCDVCKGKRYNAQTLEVLYRGKSIADVLNMTVEEAVDFFHAHPKILKRLETLQQVGLDYIELGQPATTLSGGEAQRVKLSSELAKRATGNTVYMLDEPTTGLHFADIQKLLNVLRILVNKGNSVFIIEHNLDVIKNADWIIDLGPEGGEGGGKLIAVGTVSEIKKVKNSHTGAYLSKL